MPSNNLITFRKGTSTDWSNANPVLALGEPGFDTTNNQIRIGDGTSTWNNLPVIGAQGVQGIQGYYGPQGIQGVQGSDASMQGIQGIQGDQGIQGYDGVQGYDGIQGIQGQEGIQGSIPVLNFRGEYNSSTTYYLNDIVAYAGLAYAAIQNNFSNYDPTNTSYWQVFITQTVQGVQGEGIQGVQGTQGIQGDQGTQGLDGLQGTQGAQGTPGYTNFRGEYNSLTTYYFGDSVSYNGSSFVVYYNSGSVYNIAPTDTNYWQLVAAQGTQGIQGESLQGIQGEQGVQGIQGLDGIQGSIPTLNFRGEYNSSTTYYLNDIVAYGSMAYAATQNGFSFIDPTNNSYWSVFITQTIQGIQGIQGEALQGIQGVSGLINWTGEYNSMTTYYYNDGVSYNGSSYVAIQNSFSLTDPTNSSHWQLIAAQGIQGIQGESVQGIQGEQGIQGLDGIQGYDGLQGIQGEQGIQGLDGIQGTQGESIQGTQGIQGSTGTAGNNGSQGTTGSQGTQGVQGVQGIQGNIGTAAGLNWLFSTNTNATDPGAGYFKFNAATAAATTAIYISTTDNAGGSRIAFLNSLDDSTDPSVKGILAFTQFQGVSLNQFQVTGTVTNNTGWFTIPVTFLAGGFTYANNASFFLSYLRSGNQGSQGVQGIQGTTGSFPVISNATDNRLLTSDGTSSGINAESNLTFNGTLLSVTGSGSFSSNLTLSNQTANTIASFDSNKNIVSFSMNGYASGIADADDWAARVVSNGGSVSSSTMSAVYAFCVAIASAGIRDRFLRLNLFCGTGLASCLVPLYRGRSRTGTQLGNTIDTNVNFVSGDYVETGATGGLKGLRTANKRLETGVSPSQVNGFNFHASAYEIAFSDTTYDETMGAWNTAASAGFAMGTSDLITKYEMTVVNNAIQVTPTALNGTLGHFIGSQTGNRVGYLLHPGGQLITSYVGGANLISDWSTVTWDIPIFALQSSAGTFVNYSSARLGGYSFGLSLTAAQANAYYAAMQSFQQALGRNP